MGDANSELFNHSTITYSGIFRYRFNPRIDLRAEWNYNLIEGKYTEEANPENIISFNNDINALDICGEFNFFDYEQNLPLVQAENILLIFLQDWVPQFIQMTHKTQPAN